MASRRADFPTVSASQARAVPAIKAFATHRQKAVRKFSRPSYLLRLRQPRAKTDGPRVSHPQRARMAS